MGTADTLACHPPTEKEERLFLRVPRAGPAHAMRLSLAPSGLFFEPCTWQPEVVQKLETHHLVAWSRDVRVRTRFAASLQSYLQTQPATEVCVLQGRAILDMDAFCAQLERQIALDHDLARTVDGPRGIVAALRERSHLPGRPAAHQRIILWHDADILERARPALFADIAEAITGVSAELEFGGEDPGMFIQRAVFLGCERLRDAARRDHSPFRAWRSDGDTPFWTLVSGVQLPPVSVCSVDALMEAPIGHRAG